MVQKDGSNNDNNNKRRAKGEKKRGKIVNLCATRAKKSNDRRPTDRYLEGKSGGGRDKGGFIVLETRISAVRSLFYSRDELWRVN